MYFILHTYLFSFRTQDWNFLGGLVVKTLFFHCRGHGFHPWSVLVFVANKNQTK